MTMPTHIATVTTVARRGGAGSLVAIDGRNCSVSSFAAVCSPGCVNGACTAPYTCSCNTGWNGATCADGESNTTTHNTRCHSVMLLQILMSVLVIMEAVLRTVSTLVVAITVPVMLATHLLVMDMLVTVSYQQLSRPTVMLYMMC